MDLIYRHCFTRDNFKCRHCSNRNGIHAHHVIFRSHGGLNLLNNLITLCHICHRGLHDGKLLLEVLDKTDEDVVVSFTRLKGWKHV